MLHEGIRAADALANIGLHKVEVALKDVHEIVLQDVIGVSFNKLCV